MMAGYLCKRNKISSLPIGSPGEYTANRKKHIDMSANEDNSKNEDNNRGNKWNALTVDRVFVLKVVVEYTIPERVMVNSRTVCVYKGILEQYWSELWFSD